MGIFDKFSQMVKEEKERAIRNNSESKRTVNGRRSMQEDILENFMRTVEKTTGSNRENFEIKSIEIEKRKNKK